MAVRRYTNGIGVASSILPGMQQDDYDYIMGFDGARPNGGGSIERRPLPDITPRDPYGRPIPDFEWTSPTRSGLRGTIGPDDPIGGRPNLRGTLSPEREINSTGSLGGRARADDLASRFEANGSRSTGAALPTGRGFAQAVYERALGAGLPDTQARLVASQAALESRHGRSGLAARDNNYFGVKAGSSWKGERASWGTGEQDSSGRGYREQAQFRKYANPEDSFRDHYSLLQRRFPEATTATNFQDAVSGLRYGQQGGYATDKDYGSKLESIARGLRQPGDPMNASGAPPQRSNGTPANQPNLPPEVAMQRTANESHDLVDRHYGQGAPATNYEYRQPYQPPQQQQSPEQFLQLTGNGPQGTPANAFAGGGGGDDLASFFGLGGGGGGGGDFGFGFG